MKNNTIWRTNYFLGNEVSDYGKEHHHIDYATLSKSFDAVLNNDIIGATGLEDWEQENGFVDNSEEIEELEEEAEKLRDILSDYEDGLTELDAEEVKETRERLEEIENEIEELEQEQDEQPEYINISLSAKRARIFSKTTQTKLFIITTI